MRNVSKVATIVVMAGVGGIDWQIWIDDGMQTIPCKLVITYKTQPSQPQFTALFTDWDFAPRIATPEVPAGLVTILFATVSSAKSRSGE